ncbi:MULTISPECIES: serine/threonine protein kinase [Calothrix]|uniref:non-specific serine/threonine protein kinase n=2 Tax=Calothrix TaxID=1186 RepID=A0ABR8AIL0_9CYAN|nr:MULTISPECIES: serine/threonine-protein kinase [Calothrix]MBD2199877.1 serine/threonine protein kinase [Calothrix parietina FACHB-288]MBD2228776.1 serine/threonine protein kinase [Calothrix anomala FACHB-343]
MSDPNIGRLLSKRYQLQELIGTGAMGRVYRAKDVLLGGVPVAVKFLALSIQNEKMRLQERFEREAKTCALLGQKSIHIVRVMDYGVDEKNTPFYVMEYLQGQSLSQIIRLQNLTVPRFLSMVRQICLGLQCAHNGIPVDVDGSVYPIIHRDIKPSNMLVIQDPSFGELVKVLDFGIAKLLQSDGNVTNYYLGTLAYSSPEQMEGKELDNRSDIYSLGVMMYEMLTGTMPLIPATSSFGAWYKLHRYQAPTPLAEAAPNLVIPKQLENLVLNCLAKDSGDRPQNIGEILTTLADIEQHLHTRLVVSEKNVVNPEQNSDRAVKAELALKPQLDSKPSDSQAKITTSYTWPASKPIADIVFPQIITTNAGTLPSLWIMLPQEEIEKRLVCKRYNQFMFIPIPHPMLLWITVIYNRKYGPKWLPYYLDLKTSFGQEITNLLGKTGQYRLLLFSRETPTSCSHVLTSTIAPAQCEKLQEWAKNSQILVSAAEPQMSKGLLKREYEKIKPKILAKLESVNTNSQFDLSG